MTNGQKRTKLTDFSVSDVPAYKEKTTPHTIYTRKCVFGTFVVQSVLIDGTFFFSGSSAKALLTTLQLEIHVFLKPSLHCFRHCYYIYMFSIRSCFC